MKRDRVKALEHAVLVASRRYNEERERAMAYRAAGQFHAADYADIRAAAVSLVESDLRELLRRAEQ